MVPGIMREAITIERTVTTYIASTAQSVLSGEGTCDNICDLQEKEDEAWDRAAARCVEKLDDGNMFWMVFLAFGPVLFATGMALVSCQDYCPGFREDNFDRVRRTLLRSSIIVVFWVAIFAFMVTFFGLQNEKIPCATGLGQCTTISCMSGNTYFQGYVFMFVSLTLSAVLLIQEVHRVVQEKPTRQAFYMEIIVAVGLLLVVWTGVFPTMEREGIGHEDAVDHEKGVKKDAEILHLVGIGVGCLILNIYTNSAVWWCVRAIWNLLKSCFKWLLSLPCCPEAYKDCVDESLGGTTGLTICVIPLDDCSRCCPPWKCCSHYEPVVRKGSKTSGNVRFFRKKMAYAVIWIIWVGMFYKANMAKPDEFELSPVDTFDHCPKMGSLEYWGYNQEEAEMACNEWPRLDPDFHTGVTPAPSPNAGNASEVDQAPWTCKWKSERNAKKKIPKYKCKWLTKDDKGNKMYRGKCVKAQCPLLFRSTPIVLEFGVLILTLAYFVSFGIDDLTDHIEAAYGQLYDEMEKQRMLKQQQEQQQQPQQE